MAYNELTSSYIIVFLIVVFLGIKSSMPDFWKTLQTSSPWLFSQPLLPCLDFQQGRCSFPQRLLHLSLSLESGSMEITSIHSHSSSKILLKVLFSVRASKP